MLDTKRESPPAGVPGARTRNRGVTEFLLDVLESVDSYEAHILEAEKERDGELSAFLRELRRQDVVRSREVARLLRRPHETATPDAGKETKTACAPI